MNLRCARIAATGMAFAMAGLFMSIACGAVYADSTPAPLIVKPIDMNQVTVLGGNTRPEANSLNDKGPVADSRRLDHMLLQLKRPAASETALHALIDELHNPQSAQYHRWLTPEEFAARFGSAAQDVEKVKTWLESQGFTVNGTSASGLVIDFSGTAGQIRGAFQTEIHSYLVNGQTHIANASDPKIPVALSPAVAGIVSLHDFRPKPQFVKRSEKPGYTYTNPQGTFHALVAGDIASIYNLKPLFAAGVTGTGESIMVVEDTYLYSTSDWSKFRSTFGLAKAYPHGSLAQVSPSGGIPCANPGFQGKPTDPGYGDDPEAAIDVQWASAAAPNAAIVLAACTDTSVTFGGLIALINTLDGPPAKLPSVVSISYGEAETYNGETSNLTYYLAYEQGVAEGVSIFVSSGDEDADSADGGGNPAAQQGIGVSAFTSTPYNVSVGGLDFGYTADNVDPSLYWSATNAKDFSSALSYIQEIPWNNSCAGSLLSAYYGATPADFCNSFAVADGNFSGLINAVGGSGGPSGCALGVPTLGIFLPPIYGDPNPGVVSGTCQGYPKPSWQQGLIGNPNDGVRDIPDVSLFASNGFWDAYYVVCWSNPDPNVGGGFTCTGAPDTWSGFGGTSVSSPIMAGIQALVNEKTRSRWGNPNTVYYQLARSEYGKSGSAACNSTSVDKTSNKCLFYDITQGDNDAVCTKLGTATYDCFIAKNDEYGILSTSNKKSEPAYSTGKGWDFPSGIGSVNAYNLVMGWPAAK